MEEIIPCAVKDREVFRRVWQRVMGERDTEDCPVEAFPADLEGDVPCACLDSLLRQSGGQARGQAPGPRPAVEAAVTEPSVSGSDTGPLPAEDGLQQESGREPCGCGGQMRRQVMEALEGWQFYRHLAKRARPGDARVLNAMAGEEHRTARRLAAAYFLLTGIRYWPSELLTVPALPSYWGALRGRHQAEQGLEADYRASAESRGDPDQLELYRELAGEAHERCRQLRALLEKDHMI